MTTTASRTRAKERAQAQRAARRRATHCACGEQLSATRGASTCDACAAQTTIDLGAAPSREPR